MPSTGTPSSKTAWGARAVCSSTVAEAWLPERITPLGAKARIAAASMSYGCSSQYTPASRMRLAMSCVTWEPKSRMRILSIAALLDVVIRRFLGDLHVVDVRFPHAGRGDLDELRLGAHLVDGAA